MEKLAAETATLANNTSFIAPPPLDTDKGKRPVLFGRLPSPLV